MCKTKSLVNKCSFLHNRSSLSRCKHMYFDFNNETHSSLCSFHPSFVLNKTRCWKQLNSFCPLLCNHSIMMFYFCPLSDFFTWNFKFFSNLVFKIVFHFNSRFFHFILQFSLEFLYHFI